MSQSISREVRGRRYLTASILLAVAVPTAIHSAAVSPMGVYLDNRERQGTITLFNGGTRAEEVRLEFAFGYPVSDAEGNLSVPLTTEPAAGEPSAVPWLTAFPRRIVLEPGQRQVVRVVARPPAGLDEGEYWARALIRSTGGQPPIEAVAEDVGVQIDVETVVVVPVNFRNGTVSTGLRVTDASAVVADSVFATIDLERTGNAAFLGRILVEALDEDGSVVGSSEQVLAVYRTLRRRVALAVPAGAGQVRVRYTMDTNRSDLPPGGVIPADAVVHEIVAR